MLRKLAGIFILLSFLLVKHASFFTGDLHKQTVTVNLTDQDPEQSDEEKEVKNLEITDDDFIHQPALVVAHTLLSKKVNNNFVASTITPVISLPYPPPEGRL